MNEGEGWWRGGLGAKETDVECRVESWWTSIVPECRRHLESPHGLHLSPAWWRSVISLLNLHRQKSCVKGDELYATACLFVNPHFILLFVHARNTFYCQVFPGNY